MLIACLLPLCAGAAAWGLVDEPAFAPPAATGPDGEPLVAEAPPAQARRLGARFEGGVTLEAVSVELRDGEGGSEVRLELDWRREARVSRTLGFFVHVEPGDLKGDHSRISSELLLEEAPEGKTLRDVLLISVPKTERGKTWTIWAGLWELRGDGSRKRVLDASGAVTNEERVKVAEVALPP